MYECLKAIWLSFEELWKITCVSVENFFCFDNFLLAVQYDLRRTRACTPKPHCFYKLSTSYFFYVVIFFIKKLKENKIQMYFIYFFIVQWIILSGACPFIIENNSSEWGIPEQFLPGLSGNRWTVGPSDELAFGLWQQFIFMANWSYVALKPS